MNFKKNLLFALVISVLLLGSVSVCAQTTYSVKTGSVNGGCAGTSQITSSTGTASTTSQYSVSMISVSARYYIVSKSTLDTSAASVASTTAIFYDETSASLKYTAGSSYKTWKLSSSHSLKNGSTSWSATTCAYYDY